MKDHPYAEPSGCKHIPWNKGKLIGPKPPLQLKNVWAIRSSLQLAGKRRDLALFNLAVDSKLRACDVVRVTVEDQSVGADHRRSFRNG